MRMARRERAARRMTAGAAMMTLMLGGCAAGDAGDGTGSGADADGDVHTVTLSYQRPADGPAPNFSPRGTQVPLSPLPADAPLPEGAAHPAKTGTLEIGPGESAWVPVLAAASASASTEHASDLTRRYFDLNRNGSFTDDGEPARFAAVPSQNERTGDWWTSFADIEFDVPYAGGVTEPFLVDAWIVRDGDAAPDVMRFSRRSWRSGTLEVNGVEALVAVMDADNDAMFTAADSWTVLAAHTENAAEAVLSISESRGADRMMFLDDPTAGREWPLEFRSISPDGRSVTFAVVDRPITKAEDRAADDALAVERDRPRTTTPVEWHPGLDEAFAAAASASKLVLVDFETVWCMPCRTMDEWIWSDAEVADAIRAGYVGVKLDGDIEEAVVQRYSVVGYPTMLILDAQGNEVRRVVGYQTSAQMLALLGLPGSAPAGSGLD